MGDKKEQKKKIKREWKKTRNRLHLPFPYSPSGFCCEVAALGCNDKHQTQGTTFIVFDGRDRKDGSTIEGVVNSGSKLLSLNSSLSSHAPYWCVVAHSSSLPPPPPLLITCYHHIHIALSTALGYCWTGAFFFNDASILPRCTRMYHRIRSNRPWSLWGTSVGNVW